LDRIAGAGAYWRSNTAEGGSVVFTFPECASGDALQIAMWLETEAKRSDFAPEQIEHALRLLAPHTRHPRVAHEVALTFLLGVYLLEQRRDLVADDHNGVIWTWTVRGSDTPYLNEGRVPLSGSLRFRRRIELATQIARSPEALSVFLDHARGTPHASKGIAS